MMYFDTAAAHSLIFTMRMHIDPHVPLLAKSLDQMLNYLFK